MSNCCSSSANSRSKQKKHCCPNNGIEYKEVAIKTILHHLKEPWGLNEEQTYFFCSDPKCAVIYFAEDDSVIKQSELRSKVGIKENDHHALVCYCFNISFADAEKNPNLKQFVTDKTKEGVCACDIRNPSGKCCLKDFPK